MKSTILLLLSFLILSSAACSPPPAASESKPAGKIIVEGTSGNLKLLFRNQQGKFQEGENSFTVEFRNEQGKPVDIGSCTVWLDMPAMGSMAAMRADVKLLTTSTPGIYEASTRLDMGGTWGLHAKYKGPAGEGHVDIPIQCS